MKAPPKRVRRILTSSAGVKRLEAKLGRAKSSKGQHARPRTVAAAAHSVEECQATDRVLRTVAIHLAGKQALPVTRPPRGPSVRHSLQQTSASLPRPIRKDHSRISAPCTEFGSSSSLRSAAARQSPTAGRRSGPFSDKPESASVPERQGQSAHRRCAW